MAIELYSKATLDTLLAGKLSEAPIDGNLYGRKDGAWEIVTATAAWGSITGTLTSQTDLTSYLSGNYYPLSSNPAGYLTSVPARTVNNQGIGTSYYLALGDNNNVIYLNGMSATLYVYDDGTTAYPDGFQVTICVDNVGSFQVQGQSMMASPPAINGTTSAVAINQYVMTLVKAAANTWYIA